MKSLVILITIAVAFAEPPRFFNPRIKFQRQQLAPTTDPAPELTPPTTDAPSDGYYPPSGWKPSGQAFTLPAKQAAPADSYGPPNQGAPYPPSGWKPEGDMLELPAKQEAQPPATSYGVPDNTYGPPDNIYGPPDATTESDNTAVEAITDKPAALQSFDVLKTLGTYFVLLPTGQLQQVELQNDQPAKSAKLRASAPLRSPRPVFLLQQL